MQHGACAVPCLALGDAAVEARLFEGTLLGWAAGLGGGTAPGTATGTGTAGPSA